MEHKEKAYGYHDIQPEAIVEGEVVLDTLTGAKNKKEKKKAEEVFASETLNKSSKVIKEFTPDYTRGLHDVLFETEEGGLTYRYGYGLNRLSVSISPIDNGAGAIAENGKIKLYYHQDYLGTTDYLTSDVTGKVTSWTMYNEWGEITHNSVLKCGQRELDLVKNYTGYEYDQVLGQYYAKNRMYEPTNRRFTQIDPIKGGDNWYVYVGNNPVNYFDPLGLSPKLLPLSIIEDYGVKVTYEKISVKHGKETYYVNKATAELGEKSKTYYAYPKDSYFQRMGKCNYNQMIGNTMHINANSALGFIKDNYFDTDMYRSSISAILGFTPGINDLRYPGSNYWI